VSCRATRRRGRSGRATAQAESSRAASVTVRLTARMHSKRIVSPGWGDGSWRSFRSGSVGNQGNPRRRAAHRPHEVGGRQGRCHRCGGRGGGSRGGLGAAVGRCDSPPSGGRPDFRSSESPRRPGPPAPVPTPSHPGRNPRDGPRGRARDRSASQRSRRHQENEASSNARRKEARKALWSSGMSQKTPSGVIQDFHSCGTNCGTTFLNCCLYWTNGGVDGRDVCRHPVVHAGSIGAARNRTPIRSSSPGYPEQARERELVTLRRKLPPFSQARSLYYETMLHHLRCDREKTKLVAEQQGFALLHVLGPLMRSGQVTNPAG